MSSCIAFQTFKGFTICIDIKSQLQIDELNNVSCHTGEEALIFKALGKVYKISPLNGIEEFTREKGITKTYSIGERADEASAFLDKALRASKKHKQKECPFSLAVKMYNNIQFEDIGENIDIYYFKYGSKRHLKDSFKIKSKNENRDGDKK